MRATIAAVGRTLVALGLLILLFVAYQLWGTGIFQARAQDRLENQFADLRAGVTTATAAAATTSTSVEPSTSTSGAPTVSSTPPSTPPATAAAGLPAIAEGDPIAIIQIPKIGVDEVVVQGTDRPDLQKGPGHYPATPLPGQIGNAAIAGHRTTYGAPFFRLDELAAGDEILTKSLVGDYTYVVTDTLVVKPTDTWVVENTPDAQLTLTTCNPKYSARERLVVKAQLVVEKSDAPTAASEHPLDAGAGRRELAGESLEAGLAGDRDSRGPALAWGLLSAFVGLGWWWAFRRWRHVATWLLGVGPFLAALFAFYVYLERLLPAGY